MLRKEIVRMTIFFSRVCLAFLLCCGPAYAYVGPGLGAGTVGVIVGLILSIFVAIFAFFWYPIKRVLKIGQKNKSKKKDNTDQAESEGKKTDGE